MKNNRNKLSRVIKNESKTEQLSFKRMALKSKDCFDGVLYVHSWSTGFQELIFPSHKQAANFFTISN